MANRTIILKGGLDNSINYNKLVSFVYEHIGTRMPVGTKMCKEETLNVTANLYCWVQDRKKKNAPIVRENDVWEFANQNGDIRWSA